MKCKLCNGSGIDNRCDRLSCYECGGSGVVEPLTSEEYIRTCSTEELVGEIYEWYSQGHIEGKIGKPLSSPTRVIEWLKEKRNADK